MVSPYFQDRNSLTYFRPRGRSNARLARSYLTILDPSTPCGGTYRGDFVCCTDSGHIGVPDRATCCRDYGAVQCPDGTRRCAGESCSDGQKMVVQPMPMPELESRFEGIDVTRGVSQGGGQSDPFSQMWAQIKPYFEGTCDIIPNFSIPFPCGYLAVGGAAAVLLIFAMSRR